MEFGGFDNYAMDYNTYARKIVKKIAKNKKQILKDINEMIDGFENLKSDVISENIDEGSGWLLDNIQETIRSLRNYT